MPILIKAAASTRATVADYSCDLVVCMLGTGHDWALQESSRGYTHVLVAIDKFTKWIEYKPIASLTSAKTVDFIQEIMFRFGIPNSIITDLESNFTSSKFFDFCEQRSIQIKYASVAHPRANGQVERDNGMILDALRKKLFDKSKKLAGKWIKELPYVVWSLRTQPSRALHGKTHSSWCMGRRQCYQ
jgi:transposase InsO family protein